MPQWTQRTQCQELNTNGTAHSPYLYGQLKNNIYALLLKDAFHHMEQIDQIQMLRLLYKLLSEGVRSYEHPSLRILSSSRT